MNLFARILRRINDRRERVNREHQWRTQTLEQQRQNAERFSRWLLQQESVIPLAQRRINAQLFAKWLASQEWVALQQEFDQVTNESRPSKISSLRLARRELELAKVEGANARRFARWLDSSLRSP